MKYTVLLLGSPVFQNLISKLLKFLQYYLILKFPTQQHTINTIFDIIYILISTFKTIHFLGLI